MATHSTLSELFTATADAIRAKTGSTEKIVADDFPTTIDTIVTLNEGTKDADATAADIASGKTAYVNGIKVVGNVPTPTEIYPPLNNIWKHSDGSFLAQGTVPADYLMRNGTLTTTVIPSDTFGNATAADVVSGKTFTSAEGVKVTGTASLGSSVAGTLCHSKSFESVMGWSLVPAIFHMEHNQ